MIPFTGALPYTVLRHDCPCHLETFLTLPVKTPDVLCKGSYGDHTVGQSRTLVPTSAGSAKGADPSSS